MTKSVKNKDPLVSICCMAFNQKEYIRDTLDGFVMQKLDAPFEVLIHDDASTDGTATIIKEYQNKYPDIIKPIYQKENQYSKGKNILSLILLMAKGKYIAICEGDDYWIDSNKLKIQSELLELEQDKYLCFHPTKTINSKNELQKIKGYSGNDIRYLSAEDILKVGITHIPTCSLMIRRNFFNFPEIESFIPNYGTSLFIKFLPITYSDAIYTPQEMACYRLESDGSHTERVRKDSKLAIKMLKKVNRAIDEANKITFEKYNSQFTDLKRKRVINTLKNRSLTDEQKMSIKLDYKYLLINDKNKKNGKHRILDYLSQRFKNVIHKTAIIRQNIIETLNQKIIRIFSSNAKLAVIYYTFFNTSFRRECFAVLNGRIKHTNDLNGSIVNRFFLTRSVHRIEKGLTMQDRKSVFGLDYIGKTTEHYHNLIMSSKNYDNQTSWYSDVLKMYFDSSGEHPVITKSKAVFEEGYQKYLQSHKNGQRYPSERGSKSFEIPSYEQLRNLAEKRRSVRWFEKRSVEREKIDQALKIANLSPSACNRQPFHYRILDKPELVRKVSTIPMGTAGYSENIPVFLVTVGDLSAYFSERDRHLIYIDASLANMSLMLALETLGLSSCPINWPDIDDKESKMASILDLKPYERPIMCMAIGYARSDGLIARSEKKDINSIRFYN